MYSIEPIDSSSSTDNTLCHNITSNPLNPTYQQNPLNLLNVNPSKPNISSNPTIINNYYYSNSSNLSNCKELIKNDDCLNNKLCPSYHDPSYHDPSYKNPYYKSKSNPNTKSNTNSQQIKFIKSIPHCLKVSNELILNTHIETFGSAYLSNFCNNSQILIGETIFNPNKEEIIYVPPKLSIKMIHGTALIRYIE